MMGSIKTHATQNRHHTSVFYPYIHIMYLGINVQHIYEECISMGIYVGNDKEGQTSKIQDVLAFKFPLAPIIEI